MPQGKLKVKAKIPVGAKIKQKTIAKAKDFQKKSMYINISEFKVILWKD